MKRMLALMLCAAVLICGNACAEEITPEALKQAMEESLYINLFDLRPAEAYEKGALPGASSMPLENLKDFLQSVLDSGFTELSIPVYVYGETKEQGKQAVSILAEMGFTNGRYLSSLAAWPDALIRPDQLMGDMVTTDIYGQPVDATLIAGKKLIMVNVWATYCTPCINEMADLGKLAKEMEEENMRIIGLLSDGFNADLSPNETQTALARSIVDQTGADYPHILPSKLMFTNIIAQIQGVPTTFFVNGEGVMVGRAYVGSRSYDDWKQIVADTLAGLQ